MSNHICKPKYQHQQLPPSLTTVPSVSNFAPAAVVYGNPRKRNAAIWGKRSERREEQKKKIECSAVHIIDLAACVRAREGRGSERGMCVWECVYHVLVKRNCLRFLSFATRATARATNVPLHSHLASQRMEDAQGEREERRECEKWIASRCVYGQWANWFSIGNLYSCYLLGEFKLKQMNSNLDLRSKYVWKYAVESPIKSIKVKQETCHGERKTWGKRML